jgi:hypothetical protein
MRPTALVLMVAASTIGAGVLYWQFQRNTEHAIMVDGCEAVLLQRLRSPSTYQNIQASEIQRTVAEEDDFFYANDQDEKMRQIRERNRDHDKRDEHEVKIKAFRENEPDRLSMILTYEASNGFGVPIRASAECVVFMRRGQEISRSDTVDARVDGKTSLEWSLDAVEQTPD